MVTHLSPHFAWQEFQTTGDTVDKPRPQLTNVSH
jgi:hypothetical protein